MKQITDHPDYNIHVEINPVNDRTNNKIIKFYSVDVHLGQSRMGEFILDYNAASKLIIELQKHFWYPDK